MSVENEGFYGYTDAQIRGVTDTSDARSSTDHGDDEPGAWSEQEGLDAYGDTSIWTLPGYGDSGDGCGEWFPRAFCDAHGHIDLGTHHCENRGCPRCWSLWSRNKAVAITRRLGTARYAADDGEKRAIHGYVSPPEGSVRTKREFYNGISEAYDLAQEKGVRGGVVIPHGYRPTQATKEAFRALSEYPGGIWKFIRENDQPWRDQVYWSPHYHVLGWVGSNDVKPGDTDADDGWLWQNKRSLKPFTLTGEDGYDDMVGVSRYLLSHVTVEAGENRQAYRWFGELSPASFSPEEAVSEGVLSAIERRAEEVAGGAVEDDSGGAGGSDSDESVACPVEECEGELIEIWDARAFLDQNGDALTQEERDRVEIAYEWAVGDVMPPPGLKHPTSEEDARETLAVLCGDDYTAPLPAAGDGS